ncbi:exopolysaccharide biosynthesis protein [Polaromonas sp. DSR2-3-2]|uniref:exopolysaccharide biosynthesis protein n=1 Tax=unclassified Polaromonas TaxID=2638319 RepID=UPI003CE79706
MLLSPLGNILPALTISLLALDFLERDGSWLLDGIGVVMALTSSVSGVIFAMSKTSSCFFAQALS